MNIDNRKMRDRVMMTICLIVMSFLLVNVAGSTIVNASTVNRQAAIYNKDISEKIANTEFNTYRTYSADTPEVVNFWDYKDRYNIASYDNKVLTIYRYDDSLNLESSLKIPNPYELFGTATCDDKGNYYVVWGQDDADSANCVVTSLVKYTYEGNEVARCDIKGYDSNPYIGWFEGDNEWGTKAPFHSGNCELSINKGVISCNYARKMYSGHQSNYVFYVDTDTMERLYEKNNTPYCSHSFDQDVIGTSDGGFLYANQGDAYSRGFEVEKTLKGITEGAETTFHFREGGNRDHGYNETYAQLGGLCETANTYVLCASSERTLSLNTADTNGVYCGHSEARDLFIQILKKDFYEYDDSGKYYAQGETRIPTGSHPTNAKTEFRLSGNEKDYGVIWLTELDKDHYVCNPKIMPVKSDQFVLLWEELSYKDKKGDSYYEVLDENGKVVVDKTIIPNTYLMGNTDLTYHNDCVYWVTNDYRNDGTKIHMVDISEHNYVLKTIVEANCQQEGIAKYICSDCGNVWDHAPEISIPKTGHKEIIDKAIAPTYGATGLTEGSHCEVCNNVIREQKIIAKLNVPKTSISKLNAKKKAFTITVKKISGVKGYQIRYSTKSNMGSAKTKNITGTSKTVSGLKSNQKYYVQVRTIVVDSTGIKYYSGWSGKKTVKTKK